MFVVSFVLLAFRVTAEQSEEYVIITTETASRLEEMIIAGLASRDDAVCEVLFRYMTAYNGLLLYYGLDKLRIPLREETKVPFLNHAPTFLNYSISLGRNDLGCFHWLPAILNQTKELWQKAYEKQIR